MARVTHFEIPANDPDKLAGFYEKVFDWKINKWPGPVDYWLVTTGDGEPGINGGLLRRQHPEQPMVNTITVPSLDAALAGVTGNGGTIAVPRMAVPGVGYLAYFKDPEGTIMGIMEMDASAK
jgi:predicted enzyme related to lactoylglutathione lyase